MNVTTIQMDPEQAKAKLKAYRANKHKDVEEVYDQCAKAYEALAEGTPLIDAEEAVRFGGFDEKGRPKIAISRADAKEIEFRWDYGSRRGEFDGSKLPRWDERGNGLRVALDMGVTNSHTYGPPENQARSIRSYAMVPMVPADVRPATGQLKEWHILWEVLEWGDTRKTTPPRDPFLLKHVGGTLYAILAEWDLTELERSIMKQQGIRRVRTPRR